MTDREKRGSVKLTLTPEQREQIKGVLGKDAEAIEMSVEELEERIAPWGLSAGGGI